MLLIVMIAISILWIWLVVHLAGQRGRSRLGWGIASFFGGIFALLVLLLLPNLTKEAEEAERRRVADERREEDHRLRLAALEEQRQQTALLLSRAGAPAQAPTAADKAAGNT